MNKLFEKLNLKGIGDWSETEQVEVHELMTEFQHLFALSGLELGCTSLVKHKTNVDNPVPFKERYWRIPPQEFEEVRNHLQEMLKVWAIQKSVSPWALGHVVSKAGIETNPKKIVAIMNWPKPVTVTQGQSFLGFCNYYWKFIKHYAQVAKYQLILGD